MKEFTIRVDSKHTLWWRFNVYMSVVCFDEHDTQIDYCNTVDIIYQDNEDNTSKQCPLDYNPNRVTQIITPACKKIHIYLYIIPSVFPYSKTISDSPCIDANLSIYLGKKLHERQELLIDQLGGGSIVRKEVLI